MPMPNSPIDTDKENTTAQNNDHPDHHNELAQAINDLVGELGADPAGSYATVTARLDAIPPAGVVADYIGTTAPTGWLLLDGTAHANANATYPELWANAPVGWKSGSTLTLPDARGRMAVGWKSSDTSFDTIGETGGSKDAVLVSHDHDAAAHTVTASGTSEGGGSHAHAPGTPGRVFSTLAGAISISNPQLDGDADSLFHATGTGASYDDYTDTVANHAHLVGVTGTTNGHTISTEGTSATDANLPPYIVLNKIIKAH
jgi:microcystin-dependent protein